MLLAIAIPPAPEKVALIIAGCGASLLGIALVLRGAANGRFVLAIAAAVAAGAASTMLVDTLPFLEKYPMMVMGSAAITAGLMAFVLGRLLWALVLGLLLATLAMGVVGYLHADEVPEIDRPDSPSPDTESFTAWIVQLARCLRQWVAKLFALHKGRVIGAAALVAVGVTVGFLLPRIALVVASSLVGSAGAVCGAWMLLWAFRPAWSDRLFGQLHQPLIAVAVLAVIGLAVQSYFEFIRGKPRDKDKAKGFSSAKYLTPSGGGEEVNA